MHSLPRRKIAATTRQQWRVVVRLLDRPVSAWWLVVILAAALTVIVVVLP